MVNWESIFAAFINAALPGALGASVNCVLAWRNGKIRANFKKKLFADIFIGSVTAGFLAPVIKYKFPLNMIAFVIGFSYSAVLNKLRSLGATAVKVIIADMEKNQNKKNDD